MTRQLTHGSLFSGTSALDLAVAAVFDTTPAWHCELDPAASKILAHHYRGTPNLGDITTVDWDTVAPVDVLTGGFPCQDVSSAGKRAGLTPDTRTGLWSRMAQAVDQLRPALVVFENVRGLLSAKAVRPLGRDDVDAAGPGSLRALGAVLGDLADLGYDTSWVGLPASGVGAAHRRFRIIGCAWPTDSDGGGVRALLDRVRARESAPVGVVAADSDRAGRLQTGFPRAELHHPYRPPAGRDDSQAAAHAPGERHRNPGPARVGGVPAATVAGGQPGVAADAESVRRGEGRPEHAGQLRGPCAALGGTTAAPAPAGVDWREYEPAIRGWAHVLGRPAPAPTVQGRRGQPQLNPVFVEWLMGLPEGWVSGVEGLSRNDMLRVLGNGVVPHQAVAALRWLLRAIPSGQPMPAAA
jgi:DNA (cytosine-5)-methyltransferase 1